MNLLYFKVTESERVNEGQKEACIILLLAKTFYALYLFSDIFSITLQTNPIYTYTEGTARAELRVVPFFCSYRVMKKTLLFIAWLVCFTLAFNFGLNLMNESSTLANIIGLFIAGATVAYSVQARCFGVFKKPNNQSDNKEENEEDNQED